LGAEETTGEDFAVRAESLTKSYHSGRAEVVVLESLTLRVARGERLAVVGESGAGKSTLLHLLGGLDRATTGRVFVGDKHLGSLSDAELADLRNREIGFVWQNPSLLPEFSALENVMLPLLVRGVGKKDATNTATEHLQALGLGERLHHRSGELSGGEQQRVALARALATKPRLLLADEPTGSLDFQTGERLIGQLTEIHHQHALTSVYVTHNLSFASRCDRVLELRKGVLQPVGSLPGVSAGVGRDATRLDGGTYV
jgi:lipoprotein-releasing system ATP-binding protein